MAEIELKTAPADFRFPTTNQSRHCFTRYIEFHRCIAAKGDGSADCEKFAKYYRSLCPGEWVSNLLSIFFDEQSFMELSQFTCEVFEILIS
ncbi:hypothetical protein AgCh_006515 [Apium graveolens]